MKKICENKICCLFEVFKVLRAMIFETNKLLFVVSKPGEAHVLVGFQEAVMPKHDYGLAWHLANSCNDQLENLLKIATNNRKWLKRRKFE